MAFNLSNNIASFFQNEIPNVTPTALREERIAAIRARRVEIHMAQIQLRQQIGNYLNQNAESERIPASPRLSR